MRHSAIAMWACDFFVDVKLRASRTLFPRLRFGVRPAGRHTLAVPAR